MRAITNKAKMNVSSSAKLNRTNPLAVTLAVMGMIMALHPVFTRATTYNVGDHASLTNAIFICASGDTIILTNNVTISAEIRINAKGVTIQGNNHSVSVPVPGLNASGIVNANPSAFRVFNITASGFTNTMQNLIVYGGSPTTAGGGILNNLGALALQSVTISQSGASNFGGGGVVNSSGSLYMTNCNISRNAARYGGGFLNTGSGARMFIERCTFSENRSMGASGGGGAGENQAYLYANNSTFANNVSTELGGAINNHSGTNYCIDSTFVGNIAYGSSAGGAIANNGGVVAAVNSLFAYNYWNSNGTYVLNDIYNYSGAAPLAFYSIFQSTIDQLGGGSAGVTLYPGDISGTNDTLFTGGATAKVLGPSGAQVGSGTIYQPFLQKVGSSQTPTAVLQPGSFAIGKGARAAFSSAPSNPVVGYYNGSSWVTLSGVGPAGYEITADQNAAGRASSLTVGAVNSTASGFYMLQVNAAPNGSVSGGTIYGDIYSSGTAVSLTAVPDPGYQFTSWSYVLGGGGVASTANPFVVTVTNNVTLVPAFSVFTGFTVSYSGNGSTGGSVPSQQVIASGGHATVSGAGSMVKSGSVFSCWNTRADGNGTTYAPNATYNGPGNLNLYATWGAVPVVNSGPPALTTPSSATVAEDGVAYVVIGVSDAVVPIFMVATTASSSNTNLISNASLVIDQSGTNRLLAIRPRLHQSGTATITVIARDSQPASTTNTFTVNVIYTNYPPVFTKSVSSLTRNQNAPATNLSFTISDIETAASALTVTVASSNTTLVPTANLALSGAGTNRSLALTQATNQNGTSLIEIVVSDAGGAKATNAFLLTVWPVNQPPSFTMSTNRLVYNENFGPVSNANFITGVSSGPPNQAGESNYFVLTYTTNFFAQAPALSTNGALTFQVGTNLYGTNTITFALFNSGSVSNGGRNSVTNTLTLNVPFVNQAPTNLLSTNLVLVWEETAPVTKPAFLTAISAGPANESRQTWTFATTTVTNNATNAAFIALPVIATNGTLTFAPKAHSFGTNTVTVIMTDSGGTSNGGVNAYTNVFQIGVAQTNHAPVIVGVTNRALLENATSGLTATVSVWSYDTQASNFVFTATSLSNTLAGVSVTATNVLSPTNATFTLTFAPVTNASGVAPIRVVATEGALSATNTFTLTLTPVNQAPTNLLSTNLVLVWEETAPVTKPAFLTAISAGPANESRQTWTFATTTVTNNATNAAFIALPVIATNGTLTFAPKAHSYGTNTVTVIMTDSGGTSNGGVNVYTNVFQIGVAQTNHAPVIVGATNRALLENATSGLTATVSVWSYDTQASNFVLTATSLSNTLAGVSVTATNVLSPTNATFTLTFAPVTNASGVAPIRVVATEGALSTTNTFTLTLTPVNQAPTNTLSTNLFLVWEETAPVTKPAFLTAISAGPANESRQTWTFATTTVTNNATNAAFIALPVIATNGTLTFAPKAHSFGTNTVTVIMTDNGGTTNGGTTNGGVNAYTNTFQIAVAQTNHAPVIVGATNRTLLENASSALTATVSIWSYDTQASNFVLTATSLSNTLAGVSVTATNVLNPTNATFTLTFAPVTNANGAAPIQIVATEGALSTTNTFTLTLTPVNQAPKYTFFTNVFVVAENSGVSTTTNFLASISAGASNETRQTWAFTVFSATNSPTNARFSQFPSISTNGTLVFRPATNSFGTNTVIVVMTDNGGTSNGGVNVTSNNFQLRVTQVPYPPVFIGITNRTLPENAQANLTVAFTLYDPLTTNFTVTTASSNTNLLNVSPGGSGNARVVVLAPVADRVGTASVTVTADDGALTNSTNFTVTITAVNQPPSFILAVNSITVDKYDVAVSVPNAVVNIAPGPTNESGQTVAFIVTNSSPASFLVAPAVSPSGALTFTPGAQGRVITVGIKAVDNGGTNNGAVNASAVQTLTITIPANPFQFLTGPFAGLFYDTNTAANARSGYFRLLLATNGTFGGYVLSAGNSNAFNGQFSISNSHANVTAGNYALDLAVDTTPAWTETISGSVSNTLANWNAELQSYLLGYSVEFPTSLAGGYLMALPGFQDPADGPAGDSIFSLIVSNTGVVTLTGYAADNTFFQQTSQIPLAGYFPLYVPLYNGGRAGSLIGWLDFTGAASNSVSAFTWALSNNVIANSSLTWFADAGATALYPAGFTNQSVPQAALYDPARADLLSFASGSVVLSGGSLATPITNAVTIAGNVITVDPSATNRLTLTMNRSTGQILGSFVDRSNHSNSIYSVILQAAANSARGYFQGAGQVGSFILDGP